jgi:hypothetical protein
VKKDEFYEYALSAFRPAESLLKLVPADKLDWQPGPSFMTMGQLICHMSSGIGTELRMLVDNSWPKPGEGGAGPQPGHIPSCDVQEALNKLEKDKGTLRDVLAPFSEEEFANKIFSVPWGWKGSLEKMSLDFRDHFVHHKMQLFLYLKLLGFPVNTETLYMG